MTTQTNGCQLSGLLKKIYGEFVYGNSAAPSSVHNLLKPASSILPPENGVAGATPASNSTGIMNIFSKMDTAISGIFGSPTANSNIKPNTGG